MYSFDDIFKSIAIYIVRRSDVGIGGGCGVKVVDSTLGCAVSDGSIGGFISGFPLNGLMSLKTYSVGEVEEKP